MGQVHEFVLVGFADDAGAEEQLKIMRALDGHLTRCRGMLGREYFRDADGRWVEHVVWAGRGDLEASGRLEDDDAIAALSEGLDAESVSYARCELVRADRPGGAPDTGPGG